MDKTIGVLLIEDNRLVREGIAAMLDEQPDLKVVATAPDADSALLRVRQATPQVILVDAALGDHDSQSLVANLTTTAPQAKVVVMDLLPAPDDVVAFIKAGAAGFIAKDATVDEFISTIRSVASGASVVPSALTKALFTHIAQYAFTRQPADVLDTVRMTQREREVFDLVANGLSNKQIAQHLNIAINTVKGHIHNILEKLALHTRLEIAAYARTTKR